MLVHVSIRARLVWLPINTELHEHVNCGNYTLQLLELNSNISVLVQMMIIIIK